jgi:hypothetical protein
MTKYDAELRRRLDAEEPIEETRKWYCECMANEKGLYWSDLTQLERKCSGTILQMHFDGGWSSSGK